MELILHKNTDYPLSHYWLLVLHII